MRRRCPASVFLPALSIGMILLISSSSRADEEPSSSVHTYDCGTLALRIMLKLENRPADLKRLDAILPLPAPRGHSMKELRNAAAQAGLELIGVRLGKRAGSLDRPALVFMKIGKHGHFLVVRPVGQTGKLVQVLDPNRMPDVLDAADLYSSPEWTGLALVPKRPNWPARILAGLAGLAAAGLLWSGRRKFGVKSANSRVK